MNVYKGNLQIKYCLGFYEQCCKEHGDADTNCFFLPFFNFSGYSEVGLLDHMIVLFLTF